MSANRIQKLLFSEYSDFEDMVLIESPFAQTTRDGLGIRQVQMGLTPTKLILAKDVFGDELEALVQPEVDPDTECLELVSIFPVECVNMSVFRRRTRNTLKAHFCNNQVLYFELASSDKREMFWNLWCERVKFLCPEEPKSTQSETSVGSSTSASTLYFKVREPRSITLRTLQGSTVFRWQDRDLFLGPDFDQGVSVPRSSSHHLSSHDSRNDRFWRSKSADGSGMQVVNRFGAGISENCSTSLFLPVQHFPNALQLIHSQDESVGILEEAVRVWEDRMTGVKHRRRYGLSPLPHLLSALGPWRLSKPQAFSLQMKRVESAVCLRRQAVEPEFRLGVSRRQLTSSTSCEGISLDRRWTHPPTNNFYAPSKPMVLFWTPEYWYRPRSARCIYSELQSHLSGLKTYLTNTQQRQDCCKKRTVYLPWTIKRKRNTQGERKGGGCEEGGAGDSPIDSHCEADLPPKPPVPAEWSRVGVLSDLKRSLKLDIALTTWDFDSTTLAYQLTLIDRDLFLKVSAAELVTMMHEQCSRNAPNVSAMIAFSHRICNLVATEVIRVDSVKMRARMVARFINAADKLHRLNNMSSCRSVLYGLQSPAVFRMTNTWTYIRHHHSTKYQRLATLLRLHKDPRTKDYQKMFERSTKTPPYLPSVAYLVTALLGRLPSVDSLLSTSSTTETIVTGGEMMMSSKEDVTAKSLRQFVTSFGMTNPTSDSTASETSVHSWGSEGSTRSEYLGSKLAPYFRVVREEEVGRGERTARVARWVGGWQRAARQYALVESPLARRFLLKARYREDKDNFYISLRVEPPPTSIQ